MLISYSKRETKNLGNYENVSIGIKVEDDIDLSMETAESGLQRLKNFVITNLDMEFGRVNIKNSTNIDLKHQISELVTFNASNKITIKNILTKYGVSKVSELNEVDVVSFSKELEYLYKLNNIQLKG